MCNEHKLTPLGTLCQRLPPKGYHGCKVQSRLLLKVEMLVNHACICKLYKIGHGRRKNVQLLTVIKRLPCVFLLAQWQFSLRYFRIRSMEPIS